MVVALIAVLAMGTVAPVFASAEFETTSGYLDAGSVFHAGSEVPPGDQAADVATIAALDVGCSSSSNCGQVVFNVYDGGICAGSVVNSDIEPASSGENVQSAGLTLSAGSHSWRDTYEFTPVGGGPTEITSICEDFIVGGSTSSAPEFPLGLALLIAIAVPALLALRKKTLSVGTVSV
jgi:hypothetical protein